MDDLKTKYYIRFKVADRSGVLAAMAGVFAKHNVSVYSVVQRGKKEGGLVDLAYVTPHGAREERPCRAGKRSPSWTTCCATSLRSSRGGLTNRWLRHKASSSTATGTLLDTMHAWRDVEDELARRAGGVLTKRDTDKLTTLTIPEAGEYLHELFGLGEDGPHVVRMIDELMLEHYRTQAHERPGALAFVQGLAERGVAMSVASSARRPTCRPGWSMRASCRTCSGRVGERRGGRPSASRRSTTAHARLWARRSWLPGGSRTRRMRCAPCVLRLPLCGRVRLRPCGDVRRPAGHCRHRRAWLRRALYRNLHGTGRVPLSQRPCRWRQAVKSLGTRAKTASDSGNVRVYALEQFG